MNRKVVVSGVIGIAYGALLGWAITKDRFEQQFRQAGEEYEELVEVLRNQTEQIVELKMKLYQAHQEISQLDPIEPEDGVVPPEHPYRHVDDDIETIDIEVIPGETPEETEANLRAVISKYTSEPESQDQFIHKGTRLADAEYAIPEVISRDEFAYGEYADTYSKITIQYYPLSRTLLDDDQDVVEDVDGVVGWKNLNHFGGISEDPNVLYVRNERMETDFEVVNMEDESLPLHVQYAMPKAEFDNARRTGRLQIEEDS